MSASRKDVLVKAIEAEVAWRRSIHAPSSPTTSSGGRRPRACPGTALAELAGRREEASRTSPSRSGDSTKWAIRRSRSGGRSRHTGPLVSAGAVLEATGQRVQSPSATVADFRDGKIQSFRTYFDDVSLIEQIVGA